MRSAGARSAEVAVRHDAHSNILNIGCEVASASAHGGACAKRKARKLPAPQRISLRMRKYQTAPYTHLCARGRSHEPRRHRLPRWDVPKIITSRSALHSTFRSLVACGWSGPCNDHLSPARSPPCPVGWLSSWCMSLTAHRERWCGSRSTALTSPRQCRLPQTA